MPCVKFVLQDRKKNKIKAEEFGFIALPHDASSFISRELWMDFDWLPTFRCSDIASS